MGKSKIDRLATVKIDKLVHGGQGLGMILDATPFALEPVSVRAGSTQQAISEYGEASTGLVKPEMAKKLAVPDALHQSRLAGAKGVEGKKCFVWGALPGEKVIAKLTKNKRDWAEGNVLEIIDASPDRIKPLEPEIYLATSPWQILDYKKEAFYKQQILAECFEREDVKVSWQDFYQSDQEFNYRNKMEYNFWYHNESGLVDLALHSRGSHQKIVVKGSALASDAINIAGKQLIEFINSHKIEARGLKSVIIRSSLDGKVGVSLFIINEKLVQKFSSFENNFSCFEILLANPKSPASVSVKTLYKSNGEYLVDKLLGNEYKYSTRSFFQVNIPVYEEVLTEIAKHVGSSGNDTDATLTALEPVSVRAGSAQQTVSEYVEASTGLIKPEMAKKLAESGAPHQSRLAGALSVVDMYSGVGSIGLSVVGDNQKLTMIEANQEATKQAEANVGDRKNCQIITANAEEALEYIKQNSILILDPPRAGLHKKVTDKILEAKPTKIIYLSCNPSTQARDVKLLVDGGYKIKSAKGYNFFPRTPHIESLIILEI